MGWAKAERGHQGRLCPSQGTDLCPLPPSRHGQQSCLPCPPHWLHLAPDGSPMTGPKAVPMPWVQPRLGFIQNPLWWQQREQECSSGIQPQLETRRVETPPLPCCETLAGEMGGHLHHHRLQGLLSGGESLRGISMPHCVLEQT